MSVSLVPDIAGSFWGPLLKSRLNLLSSPRIWDLPSGRRNISTASSRCTSDFKKLHEEFEINVIAPLRITRIFTPLLKKGTAKRVAFLTTEMGSITVADRVPFLGDTYSTTKAALNMAVRKYGSALATSGSDIVLLLIYPGSYFDVPRWHLPTQAMAPPK